MRQKVRKNNCKKEQLVLNCFGTIGAFANGVLRTINDDKDFVIEDMIVKEVKRLSDGIIQTSKDKEANAATHASANDDRVAGEWKIEDEHKMTGC